MTRQKSKKSWGKVPKRVRARRRAYHSHQDKYEHKKVPKHRRRHVVAEEPASYES